MARIRKKKCTASGKTRYTTQVAARDGLAYLLRTVRLRRRDYALNTYKCSDCNGWHFGHDHRALMLHFK